MDERSWRPMDESERIELEKRNAAVFAAGLVEDGMLVGLGTGSTVAYLLPALAERRIAIRCVATSVATEVRARALGLDVRPNTGLERLDIAIDGADQVSPDRWLVKGGGGAHTREKIVAAAAARFVVIVSTDKLVERLESPVPLELMEFGLAGTIRRLQPCVLRPGGRSPDGGVLADWTGELSAPQHLASELEQEPGLVSHGLFPPHLVDDVVVGHTGGAEVLPRP
jgi:ribose 5-phosphate isomerase A